MAGDKSALVSSQAEDHFSCPIQVQATDEKLTVRSNFQSLRSLQCLSKRVILCDFYWIWYSLVRSIDPLRLCLCVWLCSISQRLADQALWMNEWMTVHSDWYSDRYEWGFPWGNSRACCIMMQIKQPQINLSMALFSHQRQSHTINTAFSTKNTFLQSFACFSNPDEIWSFLGFVW